MFNTKQKTVNILTKMEGICAIISDFGTVRQLLNKVTNRPDLVRPRLAFWGLVLIY